MIDKYQRLVSAAPLSIAEAGQCTMGTYNVAIEDLNLLDLHQPLGFPAPKWFNNFRLKEWQAFQLDNKDWFVCLAVYNTKSLGTAIVMAFDKRVQKMHVYEHRVPASKLHVAKGLLDSHCFYHSDTLLIDFRNRLSDGLFEIKLSAQNMKGLPDMSAQFTLFHNTEPIVIVQPFAENRPLYSHKALMPVEGVLTVNGEQSAFDRQSSSAILDDHKGFYPWVMKYDWATSLGVDSQGSLKGFNLTDNQIQDPERFNENCLWLNGSMVPLPPVTIRRPNGVMEEWQIRDSYGRVNIRFKPLADVPNKLNLGFVAVDYHGPTGQFFGYVLDQHDQEINFDHFYGMGERKYIRM